MPVIPDATHLAALIEKHPVCKLCEQDSSKENYKVVCDICDMWTCHECAEISIPLYELAKSTNAKLNHVCDPCEDELPKVRDLIKIQQKQQLLIKNVSTLKVDVAANTTSITEQKEATKDIKSSETKPIVAGAIKLNLVVVWDNQTKFILMEG